MVAYTYIARQQAEGAQNYCSFFSSSLFNGINPISKLLHCRLCIIIKLGFKSLCTCVRWGAGINDSAWNVRFPKIRRNFILYGSLAALVFRFVLRPVHRSYGTTSTSQRLMKMDTANLYVFVAVYKQWYGNILYIYDILWVIHFNSQTLNTHTHTANQHTPT